MLDVQFFSIFKTKKGKNVIAHLIQEAEPPGTEIIWRNHHGGHSPSHDTPAGSHTGATEDSRDRTYGWGTGTLESAGAELGLAFRRAHSEWPSRFLLPLLVKRLSQKISQMPYDQGHLPRFPRASPRMRDRCTLTMMSPFSSWAGSMAM